MPTDQSDGPLQPGDRAPNVVLDAVTRDGKVAIDDFRGHRPVLVGLYRGLHCPFCRRHIAALAQLDPALREMGVESLAVVNTPTARARLYFRYHPIPTLLAASDPERTSHRAFGLPNLEFTENETEWPRKVGMDAARSMRVDAPGELPEPMDPTAASEPQNRLRLPRLPHVVAPQQMSATGHGQLVGHFLLDRDGIVRWTFTEFPEQGRYMFTAPTLNEVMSAASKVRN
jgi:peroxiredoxin